MTFLFLSLPRDAKLLDVFRLHHKIARPLLGLHESILRKPSPLPVVERELIAAFVSALNSCAYCAGVHEATTHRFGIVPDLVAALLNDIDTAPIAPKIRPIIKYVAKLTREPARLTPRMRTPCMDLDDRALHDAVAVCARFNFMNRYVEGLGIETDASCVEQLSSRRLHERGVRRAARGEAGSTQIPAAPLLSLPARESMVRYCDGT